ncbi:hypothetical protein AAFF_G00334890 [Aldrovandia affinis]|uniref:Uncharacterized protein n=1 Tax=Aldrovandia affinis TaxID=143900 RepID=A0AAD7SL71_9TELE|nr:hypothetical protein AAFF_G00334890 [Aldrovandia affinis]
MQVMGPPLHPPTSTYALGGATVDEMCIHKDHGEGPPWLRSLFGSAGDSQQDAEIPGVLPRTTPPRPPQHPQEPNFSLAFSISKEKARLFLEAGV